MRDRWLFKAKFDDSDRWKFGYLYEQNGIYCIMPKETGGVIVDGMYASSFLVMTVKEETICQCTGLKDKNGKLIWENDIVKEFNSSGDEWNLSQIVFGEYSLNLGWCTKGIKTLHEYNRRLFNVGFGTSEAGECEVIGNIFDNPELLEK